MTIEELINELRKEPNTQREVHIGVSCSYDDYKGEITFVGVDDGLFWIYGEEE